ncbi:Cyclin-dependent kinase 3 [Thelohanellus kitauei]|uniref:cyclin-dependent kinase n=1 Tax=Thelohanellus kitauei TaxID=669202 RepID=A0A0C2NJ27_THEKT|nr:Cyclin-dependent kinase 3 [Thelohanellus kitauei]
MIISIHEGVPSSAIREISVLKEFRHPNIIRLLEVVYEERKKLCLVFENMQQDLKKYMNHTALPHHQAMKMLNQILSGTAYCHSHRIIHRDIKPQNILVDVDGNVKLADFGLARCFGIPLRQYTHEVVTLWYRAPEILLRDDYYSSSVDIWSIGCIFAEMLAGRPLFTGDSEIDQLYKIFMILGTPDKLTWPEIENLQYFNINWPKWKPKSIENVVEGIFSSQADILKKMLVYEPFNRISARMALDMLNID